MTRPSTIQAPRTAAATARAAELASPVRRVWCRLDLVARGLRCWIERRPWFGADDAAPTPDDLAEADGQALRLAALAIVPVRDLPHRCLRPGDVLAIAAETVDHRIVVARGLRPVDVDSLGAVLPLAGPAFQVAVAPCPGAEAAFVPFRRPQFEARDAYAEAETVFREW